MGIDIADGGVGRSETDPHKNFCQNISNRVVNNGKLPSDLPNLQASAGLLHVKR
jgi:hypothetical protein